MTRSPAALLAVALCALLAVPAARGQQAALDLLAGANLPRVVIPNVGNGAQPQAPEAAPADSGVGPRAVPVAGTKEQPQMNVQDALIEFKKDLTQKDALASWNRAESQPCGGWAGVVCDDSGAITEL